MLGGLMPKELLAASEQAYREEEDFNVYKNIFNR
jgi:hypothetical protein